MSEHLEPTPIYDQLNAEHEQIIQQPEKRLNLAEVGPLARADLAAGKADEIVSDYLRQKAEAKRVRENYRPLTRRWRIISFAEVAGPEATAEYREEQKSLEDQARARASNRRRPQL